MQKEIRLIIKLLRAGTSEGEIKTILKKKGIVIDPSYLISVIKGRLQGNKWTEDYRI